MAPNCPRCKRRSRFHFNAKDLNRRISDHVFPYYMCPECRIIFLYPVPENLADYYPPEYYFTPPHYGAHPTAEQIKLYAQKERYKLDLVRRFVAKGRLLEIGSSWGAFSYLAKEAGFETEVVEMDADCCRLIEEMLGIRTINEADISKALQNVVPYQVVTLWHVLEHLPDPWGSIQAIAAALAPGGVLIIATPNPDSLQFRIFGRYWFHLDAPRHLELIPASVLDREMESLEFQRLLLTSIDEGSLSLNSPGWGTSMLLLLARSPLRTRAERIGQMMGKMIRPVEQKEMLGTAYTMVFQKRATRS